MQREINQIRDTAKQLPEKRTHFEDLLSRLSKNKQCELLAIIYLGRGDYSDWEEALSNVTISSGIAGYLAEKQYLPQYISQGWDMVPYRVKEEVINDAADKLDATIQAVEEILNGLDGYLVEFRERPESVSTNLLRLRACSDEISQAVGNNPRVSNGWYHEKSNRLRNSAKGAVDMWIRDHDEVEVLPSAPMSADEWIREMMTGHLREGLKMARVLRKAVEEDEIDLLDYQEQ